MQDFPPAYDPKLVEDDIYQMWETSGFFNPDRTPKPHPTSPLRKGEGKTRKAFSIVLPPPNVTGTLHLGHATMLAIEDIMIRYHRMKGDDTVWIPGTDHAAIATQNVVEKKLWKEEKKTRHDLGREKFLKKVDEFVQQSKDTIHRQMRKMGASLDWSREAYTLDAPREHAVRTVFKMMYDDGLIYRGNRIVNWCTRCQSTLADDEVNYKEEKTKFYYLKYGPVVIGTARPETKFLDKIIIIHPKDKRYKKLVGTSFDVEWIEGKVKASVVADEVADMELGSGAMTITPAHSFADFALAQKYKFEIHQIINEKGELTDAAGSMAGMPVKEAREKVVEILQKKGLVDRIDEQYVHNLSVCYRCDTPIEPLVSKQWFIDVNKKAPVRNPVMQKIIGKKQATLKELSIAVVKKNKIDIIPDRFEKVYFHWMNNLWDWCISRQIWFGHRIPVWYRAQETYVGIEPPQGEGWEQDPDTLDTWFSAGLWTFSTLGWPFSAKATKGRPFDLERFHPTSVLETGYDILFFWVARMILMTTYTLGEVPFKTVYLHGLVRDEQGRKMSKSLGNAIDPLISSEKYGTDAVRLSLVVGTTPGNDMNLSEKKIEGYRNFVNKLWNVARYVSTQGIGDGVQGLGTTLADQWILSRMQSVISSVTKDLEAYRLSQAAETLRAFTWDELADWYIEASKGRKEASPILYSLLAILLKLWHPFTPFVTEEIWKRFRGHFEPQREIPDRREIATVGMASLAMTGGMLIIAAWPEVNKKLINPKAEKEFAVVQDVITAIRALRNSYQVEPQKILKTTMVSKQWGTLLKQNAELIERLAKVKLQVSTQKPFGMLWAHPKTAGLSIAVDAGAVDLAAQQTRLEKFLAELEKHIASLSGALLNKEFVKNAPKEVVAARKEMLVAQQARAKELRQELEELKKIS